MPGKHVKNREVSSARARSHTSRRGRVKGQVKKTHSSVRCKGTRLGAFGQRAASAQRQRPLRRPAAASAKQPSKSRSRTAGKNEEEDDEEGRTDDEDSDDEQEREELEERLLREEQQSEAKVLKALDEKARQAPHLQKSCRPVPYQLVIPTYGRWKPVKDMSNKVRFRYSKVPFILKHTLGFLSRQRIPKRRVTLFVANKDEAGKYRAALRGSEWANVRIEVSVLGNKNSRNFIYQHFPEGTYVVSIDDDVERIAWKYCDGISHHVLRSLPPGGLEKIILDAHRRMKEKSAFLWGVNTSQNPRHMRHWGVSVKNGLVNGYLNGFICRHKFSRDLLRTLTDATEDSEFSVRHYAKDGVVVRYRMYAGITSPYLNRGGLQTKFEKRGERITAEQRGVARKAEERGGAAELHRLFPRLVGPPRPRRDRKTMEVDFYPNGYPTGEGQKRKMLCPHLLDDDRIEYAKNPKVVGTVSWALYEKYKTATTPVQARKLGARGIDFAFDSNWGYLTLKTLSTTPVSTECEVRGDEFDFGTGGSSSSRSNSKKTTKRRAEPVVASSGSTPLVMIKTKEMSEGHKGFGVSRASLARLAARCPALHSSEEEAWTAIDGPFAQVPLAVVRVLLHWARYGRLLYSKRSAKAVHDGLKEMGCREMAKNVRRQEALQLKAETSSSSSKSHIKARSTAARSRRRKETGKVLNARVKPGKLARALASRRGKR